MSSGPPKTPDSMKSTPDLPETHKSGPVIVARVLGILFVAGGFMLGIQGLDHPQSSMLPTALGLIVAGLVAQVFALIRSWYLYSQRNV